jgi:DNA-binding GntR family transcriptional regulator
MLIVDYTVAIFVDIMKKDIATQAYKYIKQRILTFQYLPGVKISDEEVANALGTSRTPVREALNRLSEQGLVVSRPNRGFTVKVFSKKEVEEHYRLRDTLESLAVSLAIQHLDKDRIRVLRDLIDSYPSLMKSKDIARFNDADEQFHDLIALYSDNSALYEALFNLQGKIRIIRRYDHLRAMSFQETYEEHKQILSYMIKMDVVKAKKAMTDHILNSMKAVMNILPG